MNSAGVLQIVVLVTLIIFAVLGYRFIRRSKQQVRSSHAATAAKSLGSLFSPHQAYIREMDSMIVNEVKKTEPQDKPD